MVSIMVAAVSFLAVVPYWLGRIGLKTEGTSLGTGFIVYRTLSIYAIVPLNIKALY